MKKKIEYSILLFLLLVLYIWTNNKMTLWVLVAFGGMCIVVSILNIIIAKMIWVRCTVSQGNTDDKGQITIEVNNRGIFPANHIELIFCCENIVFGNKKTEKIQLSVGGKDKQLWEIPIESTFCGRVDLKVEKCSCYDWFDITKRNSKYEIEGYFYSYPHKEYQDIEEIKSGGVEGEEDTYKHVVGYDVSEILQIREYRRGDSVKNMHWKMSAKMDKFMIKELDCPNDNSILVIFDYDVKENRNKNNDILSKVINIIDEFMDEQKGHTVYRMDTSKKRVLDRTVSEPEEQEIVKKELLETEATSTERKVSEFVMDNNIVSKYAIIIYVKPAEMLEDSGIEELDNCYTILV